MTLTTIVYFVRCDLTREEFDQFVLESLPMLFGEIECLQNSRDYIPFLHSILSIHKRVARTIFEVQFVFTQCCWQGKKKRSIESNSLTNVLLLLKRLFVGSDGVELVVFETEREKRGRIVWMHDRNVDMYIVNCSPMIHAADGIVIRFGCGTM